MEDDAACWPEADFYITKWTGEAEENFRPHLGNSAGVDIGVIDHAELYANPNNFQRIS
jgi:hypothetical protein